VNKGTNLLDYRIAGDRGILIRFGNVIDEEVFRRVLSYERNLAEDSISGIEETIKGFCTLFISYDPLKTDFLNLMQQLKKLEEKLSQQELPHQERKIIEIPAVYGGAYGPDLPLVASLLNISEEEVIHLHLANDYWIYINGAIGGTAYFKGIGKLFALPRKKTPVIFYPAGSLLFAGGLGIVFKAVDGPTGWYGIGQSPLRQWYPERTPPVLIKTGDWIQYRRIDETEFRKIKREVERDRFQLKYLE
jgi:KipI family sensor histidine kinase inhibitor